MPNHDNSSLELIECFRGLASEERDTVTSLLTWKRYRKNAQIIGHKEKTTEVYFIGSGSVRSTIFSLSGRQISYQDLGAGNMFGEVSAIDHEPRTTHVLTTEDSTIGSMSAENFAQVLRQYPVVAEAVMGRLAGLVRFLCNRVFEFSAMDVKNRVRAELLRLEKKSTLGNGVIEDMPTHAEIANRVCTHREAVTREINELEKLELLRKEGQRRAVITDVNGLAQLIGESVG